VRTRQFWLLWAVLCLNVTAGIGVLGQASAMIQEVFKGEVGPDGAARFVAALSASNMLGRFFWASVSDVIGRKATYALFFSLGPLLYFAAPLLGSVAAFVACFCVILTLYGGGFATIPAYLSDLFGTRFVSAIHGRLLTAWSAAGVLGPVLINYLRQFQLDRGVPAAEAYTVTLRLMAGLLVVGFLVNLAVRPTTLRAPAS
jgi:MFS family permease